MVYGLFMSSLRKFPRYKNTRHSNIVYVCQALPLYRSCVVKNKKRNLTSCYREVENWLKTSCATATAGNPNPKRPYKIVSRKSMAKTNTARKKDYLHPSWGPIFGLIFHKISKKRRKKTSMSRAKIAAHRTLTQTTVTIVCKGVPPPPPTFI